jgi:hypothetical protein
MKKIVDVIQAATELGEYELCWPPTNKMNNNE